MKILNTKKNKEKEKHQENISFREKNIFKPIEIGILINENNIVVDRIAINPRKNFFENKGHTYVLNRKKDFFLKIKGFLRDKYYYFFDVNYSICLSPNNMFKFQDFRAEDINTIMNSEALKILNSKKNNIFFNINPKYLLIAGLIILAAILYFTGNLTPAQNMQQSILIGGFVNEI